MTICAATVEQKAVAAPPEAPRLGAADKEVIQYFVERLRRQILAELAAQKTECQLSEKRDRRMP